MKRRNAASLASVVALQQALADRLGQLVFALGRERGAFGAIDQQQRGQRDAQAERGDATERDAQLERTEGMAQRVRRQGASRSQGNP
jgi:hypothetical protein